MKSDTNYNAFNHRSAFHQEPLQGSRDAVTSTASGGSKASATSDRVSTANAGTANSPILKAEKFVSEMQKCWKGLKDPSSRLKDLPKICQNSDEVVLAATRQYPEDFQSYAPEQVQNNSKTLLSFVRADGGNLQYVPKKWRNDLTLAKAAYASNTNAAFYFSENLKKAIGDISFLPIETKLDNLVMKPNGKFGRSTEFALHEFIKEHPLQEVDIPRFWVGATALYAFHQTVWTSLRTTGRVGIAASVVGAGASWVLWAAAFQPGVRMNVPSKP